MNNTVTHLDRLAAQYGQAIIISTITKYEKAREVENSVTKALGILQENGLYACFLYLLAKEKDDGKKIVKEMLNLLEGLGFGWGKPEGHESHDILSFIIEKVTIDLEQLLLAKETLEQMLIYARYGAKARQQEKNNTDQETSL